MSLAEVRSSVSMQSLPNLMARPGVSPVVSMQRVRLILLRAESATTEGRA